MNKRNKTFMNRMNKTKRRIENILDQGYVIFNQPEVFNFDSLKTNHELRVMNFYLDVIEKNISRMK
tara:strand:+ start:1138 stop:1335 length:198 start_codon:yes stop_codon:yes gene_type:complete